MQSLIAAPSSDDASPTVPGGGLELSWGPSFDQLRAVLASSETVRL